MVELIINKLLEAERECHNQANNTKEDKVVWVQTILAIQVSDQEQHRRDQQVRTLKDFLAKVQFITLKILDHHHTLLVLYNNIII